MCFRITITALSLILAACGPGPVPERLGVLARARDLDDGLDVREIELGTAVRQAVVTQPGDSFELPIATGSRALLFSMGAETGVGRAVPVRFAISVETDGAWQAIFEESLAAGAAGWVDRRILLPPESAPDARLRFETSSRNARAANYWGSLAYVGPTRLPEDERSSPARRPNVILMSLDTLGAGYLGAYGGPPEASPNIDSLLARGSSFSRAYAQYGNTLVSHSSLFTGLYPIHHGIYPGSLRSSHTLDLHSLVKIFERGGYLTAAVTDGGFVRWWFGFSHGFDSYDNGNSKTRGNIGDAVQVFRRAAEWLESYGKDHRFFLFIHTYEVHAPYAPTAAESLRFANALAPPDPSIDAPKRQARAIPEHNMARQLLAPEEVARLAALYQGEIRDLDVEIERFLARLAQLGLEDDTLIVLTSDHGEQFGEVGKLGHEQSLHNRELHVPLAFLWPGRTRPFESEDPVQIVDVLPTILELVGLETPDGLDGRSLASLITGESATIERRPAYAELDTARSECVRLGLSKGCRVDRWAVQTGRFKFLSSRLPPFEVLYDLESDPGETLDVSGLHPQELDRHRQLLASYRRAEAERESPPADSRDWVPDEVTADQLRELGYID